MTEERNHLLIELPPAIEQPYCQSLLRYSYLDREYETLPTANHYTVKWQCSSHTNNTIHYVNSSYLGHKWRVKRTNDPNIILTSQPHIV